MKTRLRNQLVTVKPRIVANEDGTFKVEYYGMFVKGHCASGYPTFEKALERAHEVARRNPDMIRAINNARNHERLDRLVRDLRAS